MPRTKKTEASPQVALAPGEAGTAVFTGIAPFPIMGFHHNFFTEGLSAGGGRAAGRANFSPLVLLKKVDAVSPLLCAKAASGSHFRQVVLTCQAPGATLLTITLREAVIVGIALKCDPATGVSQQEVSISFAAVQWKTPEGGEFGWHVAENRAL